MHRTARAVATFWRKAYEVNLTGLASMVAYSLLVSIFPLALIALFVAGRVLRSHELSASVIDDVRRIFPTAAKSTIETGIIRLEQASTTVGIVALVSALWVGSSFWGALDTAFCRIYQLPCRSWVRQKLFGLGMLAVVLLFIAASVLVPTLQTLVARSASDLPFGLGDARGLVYWLSIAGGLAVLFVALVVTYVAVPKGTIPWSCVWPGAVTATVAMGIVDAAFPIYLAHASTLRIGASAVFVLIALIWFYLIALILLAGAIINDMRFAHVRARTAAVAVTAPGPRPAATPPAG